MKIILTIIWVIISFTSTAQDTIMVDRLIYIRKDSNSIYRTYFNDTLFSGITKRITLVEPPTSMYLTHILKGDTLRGSALYNIPNVTYMKPYEYIIYYGEHKNGESTLNGTSWVNGKIHSTIKTNNKKTGYSIIHHINMGDTIPGNIAWKHFYKKGQVVWSIEFDKDGKKVKKTFFWKVDYKRKEKDGQYKKIRTY